MKRDDFVELSAAAQTLALGYFAARDLALKGVLRAVKRSGRWYVRRQDIEKLERERVQTARKVAPAASAMSRV